MCGCGRIATGTGFEIGAVDANRLLLPPAPHSPLVSITMSRYGWGDIPMLNVYRADMEGEDGQLPVLPWNCTLA